ncbi:hypothetical protein BKA64DRAFT_665687 [Cadophora sp. MPI-SDFR-AT-0126]|nr:hypothetical protein BKA64DRAFT_665687 [Leotiomycetes sp. MPI-SDFR-AT-0126]
MDEARRAGIQNALQKYRDAVSQHNSTLLQSLVNMMEEEDLPPKVSEKIANQLHVRELARYLQCTIPDSVKSPRDILEESLQVELTRLCNLDGVSSRPINADLRREYFDGIKACIAEKNVEVTQFPPADLEHLCTLVSGVTGPGIPNERKAQQIAFVSVIENEDLEDMINSVHVPSRRDAGGEDDPWMELWPEWEIAVAFQIGGGPHEWCGSYALYCRNGDQGQWGWRYGLHDNDWCSDVYGSVEDFLAFYSHYRETSEEWVRKNFRTVKGVLRMR